MRNLILRPWLLAYYLRMLAARLTSALLLRILLWVPQTKYDTLFWLACFFVCFYGSTKGWLYHLIIAQVWFWKYVYFVDINLYTWYWFTSLINIWKLCELGMTNFFSSSSSSLMRVPFRNGIGFFAISCFYWFTLSLYQKLNYIVFCGLHHGDMSWVTSLLFQ